MPGALWTEMSLRFLAEVALKATVILVVAIAAGWGLRRAAAATRRRMWAGAVVAVLVLPLLVAVFPPLSVVPLPSWALHGERSVVPSVSFEEGQARLRALAGPGPARVAVRRIQIPMPPRSTGQPLAVAAAPSSWLWGAGVALYLVGLAVALGRLARARLRVGRLLRGAGSTGASWQVPADIDSRESDDISLPQTVGSWRSVVLLPRAGSGWPAEWRAAVVAHEAAHVRGRDTWWQLLGEIAAVLYWFHPLAHLAARQMRIDRELAADDATLATGILPSAYARVLFELACLPEHPAPALGAVVPLLTAGGLKARVRALLEPGRPRRTRPGAAVLLGLVGLSTVLPVAAAGTRAPGPAENTRLVGRLVDGEQRPVAGAEVTFRPEGSAWLREMPWSQTVLSDADGWFHFPAGATWQDAFDVFARKGALAARKGILAVKYGTTLPTTLELRRGLTISGTVRDDTGQALSGATVRILSDTRYAPGPGPQVLATSDREGGWRIEGMLYGDFHLVVQARSGVVTTLAARLGETDLTGLDVVVPRAWPVTGWVQDERRRPLPRIRIEQVYRRWRGGIMEALPLPDGERHLDWDESADDGSFRILPQGFYVLVEGQDAEGHDLSGFFNDGGGLWSVLRSSLPSGSTVVQPTTSPVILTLFRNARVTGRVRTSGGAGIPGAEVAAAEISRPGSRSLTVLYRKRPTLTDAEGRFEVSVPGFDLTLGARLPRGANRRPAPEVSLRLQPGEHRRDVEIVVPDFP